MRETLTVLDKTAVLITPDRTLARRVISACRAWNITLDDSAGQSLKDTPLGTFLLLILRAAEQNLAPVALLSLLKHPFFKAGAETAQIDEALRGLKPEPGLPGLRARLGPDNKILQRLEKTFAYLPRTSSFAERLDWHLATAEYFAPQLWENETGETAALFFSDLRAEAGLLPPVSLNDYAAILERLMKSISIRPSWGTHPRLRILGQLEARLIQADLVILGGLNESVWPPDPGHDPWMSRPMRGQFGLPSPDLSIGLAAHDFVQGFCAKQVVMTRTQRREGGPAVPARWLQRLDTVLEAANIDPAPLRASPVLDWIKARQHSPEFAPIQRPTPCPPTESRPRRLSVTKIETWLQDPYSIYARYILGLEKYDPLEKEISAAERGDLLHKILYKFTTAHPGTLPANAEQILLQIAQAELATYHVDPAEWSFWQPRFSRLARAYLKLETDWRQQAKPLAFEIIGTLDIAAPGGPFTLSAKADRIDRMAQGAAIIDYKSGGSYSKADIETGKRPQLSLEALILQQGGFATFGKTSPLSLAYWKLTGAAKPGEVTAIDTNLEAIIARARTGLETLIATFDDPATPYINIPDADRLPAFNDYEHLARIREWGTLGDSDDSSEAA